MDLPKYPTDKYNRGVIDIFDEYRENYRQFAAGIEDIKVRYASEIKYRKCRTEKCGSHNEFYLDDHTFSIYVPRDTEWISFNICQVEIVYELQPELSLEQILEQARTLPKDRSLTEDFVKVKLMRPITYRNIGTIKVPPYVDYVIIKYMEHEVYEYDEEPIFGEDGNYLGINYIKTKYRPYAEEIKKLAEQDTYYFLEQSTNFAGFYYEDEGRFCTINQIYHPDNIIRKLDEQLKLNA